MRIGWKDVLSAQLEIVMGDEGIVGLKDIMMGRYSGNFRMHSYFGKSGDSVPKSHAIYMDNLLANVKPGTVSMGESRAFALMTVERPSA